MNAWITILLCIGFEFYLAYLIIFIYIYYTYTYTYTYIHIDIYQSRLKVIRVPKTFSPKFFGGLSKNITVLRVFFFSFIYFVKYRRHGQCLQEASSDLTCRPGNEPGVLDLNLRTSRPDGIRVAHLLAGTLSGVATRFYGSRPDIRLSAHPNDPSLYR